MAKKRLKPSKIAPIISKRITPAKNTGLSKSRGGMFASLFCKRTLIIISDHKTQHVPFSALKQVVAFVAMIGFVGWASYSSGSYMAADQVITEKTLALESTTQQNEKVSAEFALLKRDLQKLAEENKSGEISDYAKMMTEQFASEESGTADSVTQEFAQANKAAEVSDKYNAVFQRIEFLENKVKELQSSHDMMVTDIRATTGGKIAELERIIAATGMDRTPLERQAAAAQKQAEDRAEKYGRIDKDARGGPFMPIKSAMLKEKEPELYFNMKRMMTLNTIVSALPIANPMASGYYRKTSSFGTRVDPFRGALAYHSGVDLAGPRGTKIRATSDGVVAFTGWSGGYGNMVEVKHPYDFATRYGHLSKILVKRGQTVHKGDVIAVQGSTGRSTGNHLHYEVRYHDRPLNPSSFLKAGQDVRS